MGARGTVTQNMYINQRHKASPLRVKLFFGPPASTLCPLPGDDFETGSSRGNPFLRGPPVPGLACVFQGCRDVTRSTFLSLQVRGHVFPNKRGSRTATPIPYTCIMRLELPSWRYPLETKRLPSDIHDTLLHT